MLPSRWLIHSVSRVIYPHSFAQFKESGRSVEELVDILTAVNLAYLPAREGGWATRKEWRDVLSGGEKQRVSVLVVFLVCNKVIDQIFQKMGMARVFYHKPKFAVLDGELLSGISLDAPLITLLFKSG